MIIILISCSIIGSNLVIADQKNIQKNHEKNKILNKTLQLIENFFNSLKKIFSSAFQKFFGWLQDLLLYYNQKNIGTFSGNNNYPVANFSWTLNSSTVNFIDQSTSPEGSIVAWFWDFDNDKIIDSNLKNPIFTYNEIGDYQATLKVINSQGYENISLREINVYNFYVDDDFDNSTQGWQIDKFNKIIEAVNVSNNYDGIFVKNGSYQENLIINKKICIVGESKYNTTISSNKEIIIVDSDNVSVSNFKVSNTDNNSGKGVIVNGNWVEINSCIFSNNNEGVVINGNFTKISENTIFDNKLNGILIGYNFSNNNISNNIIYDNKFGIVLSGSFNYISQENTIYSNQINDCIIGIKIVQNLKNSEITNNNVEKNSIGIFFNFTNPSFENGGNILFINNFKSNTDFGIKLIGGYSDFHIYENNFIQNPVNAFDNGNNTWYDSITKKGNYFDDYNGNDTNEDGIGDTPYQIPGGENFDLYPLMKTTYQDNNPPFVPYYPIPIDGCTENNIDVVLQWSGGDPDPNDYVFYDVYFGTNITLEKISSNQSQLTYNPGLLEYDTFYYWYVVSWDNQNSKTKGPLWSFRTINNEDTPTNNNPPFQPYNPNPTDGLIGTDLILTISWESGDPDCDDVTFDFYFGNNTNPAKKLSNYTQDNYNPGLLEYSTWYYWKVACFDSNGASTTGPIWSFKTKNLTENDPPYIPKNPFPANDESDIDVNSFLVWNGGDPDENDVVTYNVYFSSSNPPAVVSTNQSSNIFFPDQLSYQTTYYWKIVAWDDKKHSTTGPIWNFTTESLPINSPPNTPSDPSPENNEIDLDTNIVLEWDCIDPDGDNVTFDVYLEENDTTPDLKVSSYQVEKTHNTGNLKSGTTYYWKIVARDQFGLYAIGPVWNFKTENITNHLPNIPSDSNPPNFENTLDLNNIFLSWTGGDVDSGDTVTYDVYFGSINPPPKIISNQSQTTYVPPSIVLNSVYYWKIVAWDSQGQFSRGPIWRFTTLDDINVAPRVPDDPEPDNGEENVNLKPTISWQCSDPDIGDTLTYDIYFGNTSNPPKIVNRSDPSLERTLSPNGPL
jgi:parallel beta-helix repeat protein